MFVSGRWWLPQLATQLTGQQLKIEQLDYQLNLPNNLQISQFTGQYQQQQINIKHANIHFSLWPLLSFNWPKMTAVDVANIDITINSKVLAQQLQQPSHSQSTPFTLEQFNQLLAELPDSKIDKLSLFIDQQNTPQWQLHHFAWQQGKVQAWLYWQQQALAIIHSQLSQQDWQVNAHIPVMNNLNMLRWLSQQPYINHQLAIPTAYLQQLAKVSTPATIDASFNIEPAQQQATATITINDAEFTLDSTHLQILNNTQQPQLTMQLQYGLQQQQQKSLTVAPLSLTVPIHAVANWIDLPAPLQLLLADKPQQTVLSLHTDQLRLDLARQQLQLAKLTTQLSGAVNATLTATDNQLSYAKTNAYLNNHWRLQLDANKLDLVKLKLVNNPKTQANIDKITLQAQGQLDISPSQQQLVISNNSQLTMTKLKLIDQAQRLTSEQLTLISLSDSRFSHDANTDTKVTKLLGNVSPLTLQLKQIKATDDSAKIEADIAKLLLSSHKPISFAITPSTPQLQWQYAPQQNQLKLNLTNTQVIQQKSHGHQQLFIAENIALQQQLDWDKKLTTQEQWHWQQLQVTSQHQLTKALQLAGQWQIDWPIQQLTQQLPQWQLPTSLNDINGQLGLNIDTKMQLGTQPKITVNLDSRINNSDISFANTKISQLNVSSQCHWQNYGKQARQLNCNKLSSQIESIDNGLTLSDISSSGTLQLTPNTHAPIALNLAAEAKLLGGKLMVPAFSLESNQDANLYLILQGLSLAKLLAIQPLQGIYADGVFDGVLPANLTHNKLTISGGRLAARAPGGLIEVTDNPYVTELMQSQPELSFAFNALKHLQYSTLASTFDMDAKGDAILKVKVEGKSKGIERPIVFNYSHQENMLQLLKSLQISDNLQDNLEQSIQDKGSL
uniref:YdbH domain-containing protein n=1 Tax=Shewanella marina TaxID=487319 RepID=UPI00046F40DF|nr:YdbH domain-containing protein [Shewanella marina]